MALNKISLVMLESKVVVEAQNVAGGLKITYSDGTSITYSPPSAEIPTVDLSNYYTKSEADARFLTKSQADALYAAIGSGGGTTPHGYLNYMPGVYTFTAESSGVFVTATAGGGGAAMDGLMGLAGTDVAKGGRGEYCYRAYLSLTVGQSYQIVVGDSGENNRGPQNGDGRGTAGGPTSFGTLLTLRGGGGGFAPYYGSGTDGTSYGSTTIGVGPDSFDSVKQNYFGYGGQFTLQGFMGVDELLPGRGFMSIEW